MKPNSTFTTTIAKVSEQLFHGEVLSCTLPGSEGELTILPHHAPLISLLKSGTIRVRTPETVHDFVVQKGVLEVSNNHMTVLIQK